MSVLRGYLRLSRLRFITFALLFISLIAAGAFLAQSYSAGFATRRSSNDGGTTADAKSGPAPTSSSKATEARFSYRLRRDGQSEPAQGCTVNCTATVPATG